ncbi:MAG: hypothetical protein NTV89_00300 [Proteobacteria bacterium]|nr:hypothetical protein [Pseudomonadota bacterium]
MKDQSSEWRRIVDRQHDQINQRANVFLLINGLLLTSVSTTSLKFLPKVLSLFGFILNVLWCFLGNYSKKRYAYFYNRLLDIETELPEADQIYTQIKENAPKETICSNFKISSTDFLSLYLPIIITALWGVIFILIISW